MTKELSIYIHIPFCDKKCAYCNFISFTSSVETKTAYFSMLEKEIIEKSNLFKEYIVKTIYFGGGTPSSVNSKQILKTIDALWANFKIFKDCEISIECNPNSFTKEKAQDYLQAGINRISFGVQSLNDKILKKIGRLHTAKEAIDAIKIAKKVGFKNISCDLMLALPFQTKKMVIKDAKKLLSLNITHLSAYMLKVESGTVLKTMVDQKLVDLPSDDESAEIYDALFNFLKKKQFYRYETSNFSKVGFMCKHNLTYWNMGNYLGMGLGAHSYFFETRSENTKKLADYLEGKTCVFKEKITKDLKKEEFIMLALRTYDGIDLKKFKETFGSDLLKDKKDEIDFLLSKNAIKIKNNHLKIRSKFYGTANQIIVKLI